MIYDYIIIGGGISGLYTAYKLLKNNKKINLIILEKNKIGGRLIVHNFYNTFINLGAGVGRYEKDKLLVKLLNELKIKYNKFTVNINIHDSIEPINIKKTIQLLKKNLDERVTVKKHAMSVLGKKQYENFLDNFGYTDFEDEDIYQFIKYYGYDDNISGWTAMSIRWDFLIKKLSKKVGLDKIKENITVTSIDNNIVKTNKGIFEGNKIIIATPIDTIKKLLPNYPIYKYIDGQPFLRIYARFSNDTLSKYIETTTNVKSPLRKIIPINPDKKIYMIAYCDNGDAIQLKKYMNNKKYLAKLVQKTLNCEELKIIDIKSQYWNIGTHYYKPLSNFSLPSAQNPEPNIFVVGEAISNNQGWTQGALESVENVFNKLKN